MKKWIIIAIVVLGLAGGAYYWFILRPAQASAASTPAYTTQTLATGDLKATISAIGKVRSRQAAEITWAVAGTVESVAGSIGQNVTSGQELARLEQASLPQGVILAEAELYDARQSLDDLQATANEARVTAMQDIVTYQQDVRDAQYQLDNFTTPTDQKDMDAVEAVNTTEAALDQARLAFEPYRYLSVNDETRQDRLEDLNNAQANYNTAVKRLSYEYDLEVAQNNLDKAFADYNKWKDGPAQGEVDAAQARIAAQEAILAQAWLEAPFAGTLTTVYPLVGDKVSAGNLAFRIDDLSKLYVDVEVSEIDVSLVQAGQPAVLTLDALRGRTYDGMVTEVSLIGTDSSGVVNYQVTVELTNPDAQVRPGMTAEATITVAERQNVLLIPNEALKIENGKQVVKVMNANGTLQTVEVTTGVTGDLFTELVSGDLQAGMAVVVSSGDAASQTRMMGPFGRPPRDENRDDSNNRGSGQGQP
ncbi:MAG: efflux RND transporter periplasmic adaptor subunit [Chloroflexota bacterium]